jgi:SAM-dependent methyltransferase
MRRVRGKPFDKYAYYIRSVQAPEIDTALFLRMYREIRKKKPRVLREDFCGTFVVSMEWVKLGSNFEAHGVDLDPEPLQYGCEKLLPQLTRSQQSRVHVHNKNVMDPDLPKADIVISENFSHYIFKIRTQLRDYFRNAYRTLLSEGLFIVDCFGGSTYCVPNQEQRMFRDFSYFWDQKSFNPISNEALSSIHFRLKGQKMIRDVFTYDFRLWSPRELREIMMEVGFSTTYVYWEGATRSGSGNGVFKASEVGEACQQWSACVVGVK